MKLPFVVAVWEDAFSPLATDSYDANDKGALDKIQEPLFVHTPGWLIRNDEKSVVIGGEWTGDTDFRNITVIPKAMIREILPIRYVKGRKHAQASSGSTGVSSGVPAPDGLSGKV